MNETTGVETSGQAEPGAEKMPEMEVAVERVSDVERKLDVEIPWGEVKTRLDEAYSELKKGVTIKGFRKGKVPRTMLERLFGKHVVKEVAQRLVQVSLVKAMEDNQVTPVSEPQVEDSGIQDGQCFKYTAVMQVVPEVDPKDYFDVEVTIRPAKVTDDAVEMALKVKQQEMTAFKTVEGRATRAGDVLMVDVMGKVGSKPVSMEKEMVELGDPPREPIEGLAAKLTGIPCDQEELEVELDLADPDQPEAAATNAARLLVTVLAVREKVVPELDDDFAKDTGEAETLEGLKEVLRKKLLDEDEQRARDEAKDALLGRVLKHNDVPVVPALVERHLERRIALQKALMGLGADAPVDDEALKDRMRDDATEAVQRSLLLAAIGKKEKVEVQEADVEKRLAEIAASRGQNVARVRSEYEKEGLLAQLRDRLAEDKTLDLLMSKANIIIGENAKEADAESPVNGAEPDAESEAASANEPAGTDNTQGTD